MKVGDLESNCNWRGVTYAHDQTCDDIYDVIAFYWVEKENEK